MHSSDRGCRVHRHIRVQEGGFSSAQSPVLAPLYGGQSSRRVGSQQIVSLLLASSRFAVNSTGIMPKGKKRVGLVLTVFGQDDDAVRGPGAERAPKALTRTIATPTHPATVYVIPSNEDDDVTNKELERALWQSGGEGTSKSFMPRSFVEQGASRPRMRRGTPLPSVYNPLQYKLPSDPDVSVLPEQNISQFRQRSEGAIIIIVLFCQVNLKKIKRFYSKSLARMARSVSPIARAPKNDAPKMKFEEKRQYDQELEERADLDYVSAADKILIEHL
ncbi:hypothetical protein ACJJTC_000834 [Scirpophaga incertulas]